MKKFNWIFLCECVIVAVLLLTLSFLIKDEKQLLRNSNNQETDEVAVEEAANIEDTSMNDENTQMNLEVSISENSEKSIEKVVDVEKADEDDKIKIVVFGDSIWYEDEGNDGIAGQIMEQLDVQIYNCAIGGTTAAVDDGSERHGVWTSRSFNGMMYVARGVFDADDLIPNDAACEVIKTVDFNEVDYVIVSYGLNDYFADIPIYPQEYYDIYSYVGALRHGIYKLKEDYPQIQVILTSPTYCEWFKGERQFELGAYVEAARSVAGEMEVHFLDMYHAMGSNPNEKMQYLSDGVHLTEDGNTRYANWVIQYFKELGVEEKQ